MVHLYLFPYLLPLATSFVNMAFTSTGERSDDVQLSSRSITTATHYNLINCMTNIKSWMQANSHKLNCDKSDPNWSQIPYKTTQLSTLSAVITSRCLPLHTFIIWESFLTATSVLNTRSTKALELLFPPHLKSISTHHSFSAVEMLIHAFITSRIDYCNRIL